MRLAGMQPYFFPYLGYFDLINNVDQWIFFDTPQYIKNGWVNRNRIFNPHQGWQYIIVPVQNQALNTPIFQVVVSTDRDWKGLIVRQLYHYHKSAPYYKETLAMVEDCLNIDKPYLSKLNLHILKRVCDILKIPFPCCIFSEANVDIGPVKKPGDWALQICKAFGATTLVNPPGGRNLYNPKEFQEYGIKLIIREFPNMFYPTGPYQFEPALSIIDVLMWNSPKQVKDYLDRIKLPR
jgi:hypothetical protein